MKDEWNLKLTSLLRRMGLANVPKQVLACVLAVAILLVGVCAWRFWPSGLGEDSSDFQISQEPVVEEPKDAGETAGTAATTAMITVDVEGEVASPGLYELQEGSRIGDAIEKAGGLTKKASRGSVNLAEKLQDGQLVTIAAKGQEAGNGTRQGSSGAKPTDGSARGLVNINMATAEELQTLSGIGESISQRIVEYREANGKFASADDLTKVSGIGETRLASIRDKICV